MMNQITRLFKEEEGQALTEYGLLVGLVALAVVTVLATLGDDIASLIGKISAELTGVETGGGE